MPVRPLPTGVAHCAALLLACRDADRVAGLLEANGIYNTKLLVNRVRPDMIQKNDMMSVKDVQVRTYRATNCCWASGVFTAGQAWVFGGAHSCQRCTATIITAHWQRSTEHHSMRSSRGAPAERLCQRSSRSSSDSMSVSARAVVFLSLSVN